MEHHPQPCGLLGDQPGAAAVRVRLDVAYDGGPFAGWAVQPGLLTVQGVLEDAFGMLLRRPVRVTVAGRTDAGVHARGQVVHVDLEPGEWEGLSRSSTLEPAASLLRRLGGALNRILAGAVSDCSPSRGHALTGAISVRSVEQAPAGFDARFSALWRRYSYHIADDPMRWDPLSRQSVLWHKSALDLNRLNNAAMLLVGLQDFHSFCKPREGATSIRELQRFDFVRDADGTVVATIQADAFCHNMVRALIGASLFVGEGRRPPEWLHERLMARTRHAAPPLAPPHALVLEEVRYPDRDALLDRALQTRAKRQAL